MAPRADVIQILSHASVFVCPSVYEPLGIVNLEAMACEAPVVATRHGRHRRGRGRRRDRASSSRSSRTATARASRSTRAAFVRSIAGRVGELLASPERAAAFGRAGRVRAVEKFSWRKIAEETVGLYRSVLAGR